MFYCEVGVLHLYRYIVNSSQSTVKHSTYVKNELNNKFSIQPYRVTDTYLEYNLMAAYKRLFDKSVKPKWVIEDRQYQVIQDEDFLNFAHEVVEYANTINYVNKCIFVDKQALTDMSPYNPNSVGCLFVHVDPGVTGSEIDPYDFAYVTILHHKTPEENWRRFVDEVVNRDPYHYFTVHGRFYDDVDKVVFVVKIGEFGIKTNYDALQYIKSVFKGKYGGLMADVKLSKPTMKWAKKYVESQR